MTTERTTIVMETIRCYSCLLRLYTKTSFFN